MVLVDTQESGLLGMLVFVSVLLACDEGIGIISVGKN